jgi:hypothetical protein
VAEQGLTVVLSSHLLADLERVCDYLIVLQAARVQVLGPVDELLDRHKLLVGPRRDPAGIAEVAAVVRATHTARQSTLLVRTDGAGARPDAGRRRRHPGGPRPGLPGRPLGGHPARPGGAGAQPAGP